MTVPNEYTRKTGVCECLKGTLNYKAKQRETQAIKGGAVGAPPFRLFQTSGIFFSHKGVVQSIGLLFFPHMRTRWGATWLNSRSMNVVKKTGRCAPLFFISYQSCRGCLTCLCCICCHRFFRPPRPPSLKGSQRTRPKCGKFAK